MATFSERFVLPRYSDFNFDPKQTIFLNPKRSFTNQIWKPYPRYKELYGVELIKNSLKRLEHNGALRQLCNGKQMINYKSLNPAAKELFLKKSENVWINQALSHVEDESFGDKREGDVRPILSPSESAKQGENSKDGTSKSFVHGLSRSSRIITPEVVSPIISRQKCMENQQRPRGYVSPVPVQQPLIEMDYKPTAEVTKDSSELSCLDYPPSVSASNATAADLERLNQDQNFAAIYCCDTEEAFSGFELAPPKARPPSWYRYRLPQLEDKERPIPKVDVVKRNEASRHVMADLVSRRRATDVSERKRAEEQAKIVAEHKELMRKVKEQRMREQAEKQSKELRQNQRRLKCEQGSSEKHHIRRAGLNHRDIFSPSVSMQSIDEELEIGLSPENKLAVLKDFVRLKHWNPKDCQQVAKVNDLIDYWSKHISSLSTDQEALVESHGWKDETEKVMFRSLIEYIKARQKFAEFDPYKILHTAYLRIGREAVKGLEKMCMDVGKDPGIHYHTEAISIYDQNIFEPSMMTSTAAISESALKVMTKIHKKPSRSSSGVGDKQQVRRISSHSINPDKTGRFLKRGRQSTFLMASR